MKPVIFLDGLSEDHRDNTYAQSLLLKAISGGVTDPKELMKMSGIKTAAGVFRTLDKLAIRKEYHTALQNAGIDLDYVVRGIKNVCENAFKDSTKLDALKVLLKSIGLDKYDVEDTSGKNWEELVLEDDKTRKLSTGAGRVVSDIQSETYEVTVPVMPDDVKEIRDLEERDANQLYGRA